MATVRGCELPDDLAYDVGRDVWVRREGEEVVCGMTDVAQTRCGRIVTLQFRRVGRVVERGRSLSTVESAKWVGPFPAPLTGEITAVNETGFAANPLMVNTDPYGEGWLVRLRPTRLDREWPELLTGEAARRAYEGRIAELDVHCYRCQPTEETAWAPTR
ncbi:MAG: glycine cleavage system protein [Chloroflexi bacterium]|nr:glycine cleavage system protein [Chloroflexota bacterium]